jgi:putative inorganic carbon (hco3(-)) transporter
VYQQGVKRIVGIWTSGLGAPNYFGMLAMLSLPFAYFWFQLTDSKITRLILLGHFALSFLSIVFSGTRGALLGAIVFVMLNMRNIKRIITISVLLAVLLGVAFVILPDHLRYRYFGIVMSEQAAAQQDENAEEISEMSAKSRIEGLVDGYKLAKLKPFTGFGPASSARARNLVNPSLKFIYEDYLQLHNLYGQILAESGFVGMAIFMSIVFMFFLQLRKLKEDSEEYPFLQQFKFLVQNFMLLMLFYGMVSHTLYRYYWFIIFALHGALLSIVKFDKEKLEDFALEREEEPLEISEGET